jgi:protein SCO1
MQKSRYTYIAALVILIFGIILFYVGTDGFRAFTAESARKYELMQNKPQFPDVTLEDSEKRKYTFQEFAGGKYAFVTFMYTNCTTVCPKLEWNMAKVYEQIPEEYIGEDIVFLSISFDPENDDPKTLAKYRTYFNSDGKTWRMARVPDQDELDLLLDQLGVIVIPDGYGNFQHNTAFYFIHPSGHLIEVMDYEKIDEAAQTVKNYLEKQEGKK